MEATHSFFFSIWCDETALLQGRENLTSQHQCETAAQICIHTDMKTEKLEREEKHHTHSRVFCFNRAVLQQKI